MTQIELFPLSEIPIDPTIDPYRYLLELIARGATEFQVGEHTVHLCPPGLDFADYSDPPENLLIVIYKGESFVEGHSIDPIFGHLHGSSDVKPPVIPLSRSRWSVSWPGAIETALWIRTQVENQVLT